MFKERSTSGGRKGSIDGGEDGDEDGGFEADDSLVSLLADDATAASLSGGEDSRNVLNKNDLVRVTAAGGELEHLLAHVISVDVSTQSVKVRAVCCVYVLSYQGALLRKHNERSFDLT
jgi:hypothetical protein